MIVYPKSLGKIPGTNMSGQQVPEFPVNLMDCPGGIGFKIPERMVQIKENMFVSSGYHSRIL